MLRTVIYYPKQRLPDKFVNIIMLIKKKRNIVVGNWHERECTQPALLLRQQNALFSNVDYSYVSTIMNAPLSCIVLLTLATALTNTKTKPQKCVLDREKIIF
jgi:hypothetical protein